MKKFILVFTLLSFFVIQLCKADLNNFVNHFVTATAIDMVRHSIVFECEQGTTTTDVPFLALQDESAINVSDFSGFQEEEKDFEGIAFEDTLDGQNMLPQLAKAFTAYKEANAARKEAETNLEKTKAEFVLLWNNLLQNGYNEESVADLSKTFNLYLRLFSIKQQADIDFQKAGKHYETLVSNWQHDEPSPYIDETTNEALSDLLYEVAALQYSFSDCMPVIKAERSPFKFPRGR